MRLIRENKGILIIAFSARGISMYSELGNIAVPSSDDPGFVGHRGADAGVGATAAYVAGHVRVDLGGAGLLAAGQ
jgi:hypothetical protein